MSHMPSPKHDARHKELASRVAYLLLCFLWIGTVSLSIRVNTGLSTSKIKLSATQLHMIDLAVSLPGLLIWSTILFAGLGIRRYVRSLETSKEGPGFQSIAYGIFALLVGLVVSSYLGGLQQLLSQHAADPQKVKTTFVIITNYVSVVSYLVTYSLLLHGSQSLLKSLGVRLHLSKRAITTIAAAFVGLTIAYLWLIHANPARQVSVSSGFNPTFGLPYWLIVTTVALPTVVAWLIGLLALIGMHQYRAKTTGIVYKILFQKLMIGMTLFIGLTMLLQLLVQVSSWYTNSSLSALLALIAVIYLILTYAFVLIAQGAKKLNTIETLLLE